jgi:hypothetical protein
VEKLKELEVMRENNKTCLFYRNINDMRNNLKPRNTKCRNKNGNLVTDKKGILRRWIQHFDELLNREVDDDFEKAQEHSSPGTLNVRVEEIEEPSLEELEAAVKKIKNNKSPGIEKIQVKLIKSGGEDLYKYLLQLIRRVWNEESLLDEWMMGILGSIHNKGDPLDCKKYQGIFLLSFAYKILSNILYAHLLPFVEKELGSYQAGFQGGKSTTDQIFSM